MFGSKVKVKVEFEDGGEAKKLNFQANYFLPSKGDRIHIDSDQELYVVSDKITHFGDDDTDYTLILKKDRNFKGELVVEDVPEALEETEEEEE